jgi:hypothetical protein
LWRGSAGRAYLIRVQQNRESAEQAQVGALPRGGTPAGPSRCGSAFFNRVGGESLAGCGTGNNVGRLGRAQAPSPCVAPHD